MASNNRPSWRGANTSPQGSSGGIGVRRSIATFVLVLLGVGLVALSAWKINQRAPHFLIVAIDGNHLKTKWLDQFACPPLRFTQNTLAPLVELKDKNLHFIELDLNSIERQLAENIQAGSYRKQDALIAFAQVQCLTIGEKPCLLTADFSLTDQGTVSLEQFLKAFSSFPGNKILALDAGDIIADPLASSMKNQFVQKLHEELKAWKDNNLWVLVSHGPGEISLDDCRPREKRRLFGRALTEALTGGWRVPGKEMSEWLTEISNDRQLSLSELASYIYRRVRADSQQTQTPWILHAGEGKVVSDERTWPTASAINLGKIDRQGRWLGLASAATEFGDPSIADRRELSGKARENPEEPDDSRPSATKVGDNGLAPAASADKDGQMSLAKNVWMERWMQLDKWWQPAFETLNDKFNWSYAELYPQHYRALRSALLDAQQRDLAGIPNSERFKHDVSLPTVDKQEKDRLDALFPPATSPISSTKLVEPQAKARMIRALSHASIIASDAALLAARIDLIEPNVSGRLINFVTQISDFEKVSFTSSPSAQPITDAEDVESATQSAEKEILQLASSVQERYSPILVEALLSYAGLSAEHRNELWSMKTKRSQLASQLASTLPTMPDAWRNTDKLSDSNQLSEWFKKNAQASKLSDDKPSGADAVDLIWPMLEIHTDGRNLAESGKADLTEGSILRWLPNPPTFEPTWSVQWENPSDPFRIQPGSNKMILILAHTYPGPKPDPKITVRYRTLPNFVEAIKINGQRIDADSKQVVVEWKDLPNKQLPIELIAKNNIEQAPEEPLSISLSTSTIPDVSNVERRLRFVGAGRIEMKVEQQLSKNGKVDWHEELASGVDKVIRLRPFAGHQSRFRLKVTNRSEIPRSIHANVYALKKWDAPAGRIAASGEILPGFPYASIDPNRLKKLPLVATTQSVKLAAGAVDSLPFESIADAKPASETDKDSKAASAVPKSTSGDDVSGGMVVVLIDKENTDFEPNYFFIEYIPTEAHEYLKAEAQIVSNAKARELVLKIHYLDIDGVDLPDLGPIDDKPLNLKLHRESWMGEELKIASLNGVLGPVAKANRQTESTLSVEIPKPKSGQPSIAEAFIGLDVNESPRVLSTSIRLTADASTTQLLNVFREEQPRAEVRSVGEFGKDKSAFHSFLPPDFSSEIRPDLDRLFLRFPTHKLAYFKNPKELEVRVGLDLNFDFHGSQPRTIQIILGNQNATLFGRRDLNCRWVGTEADFFTLDCKLLDHVVTLATSGLVNQVEAIKVLVDNEVLDRSSLPIKVAFDQQAPTIGSVKFDESRLIVGATAILNFTLEDEHSGCEPDSIQLKIGQGIKAKPFDSATLRKISGTNSKVRYRAEFTTDEMKTGEHKFVVTAVDRAGNSSDGSAVATLTIDPLPKPDPALNAGAQGGGAAPAPVPAVTGTIEGIVKLFGREAPSATSDLVVKLETKGEEVSVNDGTGKFKFAKVPIGPYKIVAQANYQGMPRNGVAQGVFEKEADFKKQIQITIK